MNNTFDVIVIGGGHAGIEASNASARMGCTTALITMNYNTIGKPSCNPSIGGSAKGHLVKEIDALGGAIGYLADSGGIQFKMLNKSKGPAVWSPRCQIDIDLYPVLAYKFLFHTENLSIIKSIVSEILIRNNKVYGVKIQNNEMLYAKSVIFCAGTFLNGLMFCGTKKWIGGRFNEESVDTISNNLLDYGFERGRLKTGTPPRIESKSIDFSKIELSKGDAFPEPFSYKTQSVLNKIDCYSTNTTEETHDILRTGFNDSPLFSGIIKGTGPRYCPSIEDKVSRFTDKISHKLVLEPEGLTTNSVYINGFSTSLPLDIQTKAIHSVKGLEHAEFIRPGYAIEYDYFPPHQLKFTLETKLVEGLYFAGQINGTSGYEEAASQGIIAGINASLKIKEKEEFILKRSEAYIGVLIDDLINKSTEEPYRIFTSLAEYRLLLRQDNAKYRLMKYGYEFGLIPENIYNNINNDLKIINESKELLKTFKLKADVINEYFAEIDETSITDSTDIFTLTKRNNIDLHHLLTLINPIENDTILILKNRPDLALQLKYEIKYEGYINRQLKEINYFLENENKKIPSNFNYNRLTSLSNEAREKLNKIRPASLGQASRISGVSASDVSILSIYLR